MLIQFVRDNWHIRRWVESFEDAILLLKKRIDQLAHGRKEEKNIERWNEPLPCPKG